MARKQKTPGEMKDAEMLKELSKFVNELKKQGMPDELIAIINTIIFTRPEELDLTNEERFKASLNKAVEKFIGEMDSLHEAHKEKHAPQTKMVENAHYLMRPKVQKYTLRIALKNVRPIIWRKLEVPSNISLTFLGTILIEAMGWENCHLHQFVQGTHFYSPANQQEPDMFPDFGDVVNHKSEEFCISDLLHTKGDKVGFDYDFGDDWAHQITLSSVDEYPADEPLKVKLIAGKNACPPENCGGIWGYEALCKYYYTGKKERGRDKAFYAAYIDDYFDPEDFPLSEMKEYIDSFN